jgi:DNA-directed RNA polymerase specialized sigma24 family protein
VTTTSARAEQIATFYARHADRLHHIVAANAHAPEQTIEDACQHAWAILLRRPEVTLERGGFAWLATVAIREAWRLASRAREIPVGAYLPGDPEPGIVPEPPADNADPADRVAAREQHAQRVQDLARLKPREREALYLKALGHSYQEIAALSRGGDVIEPWRSDSPGRRHVVGDRARGLWVKSIRREDSPGAASRREEAVAFRGWRAQAQRWWPASPVLLRGGEALGPR